MLDRFHYTYGTFQVGDAASSVDLGCVLHGPKVPHLGIPKITWRRGIDLAPIDVLDAAQVRWLEACVWADQTDRLARLRAAVGLALRDPPRVLQGDLLDLTPAVASEAPPDSTLVVMQSATLAYLDLTARGRFVEMMRSIDGVWISNEAPGVVPRLEGAPLGEAERRGAFVLAEGSRVLGLADPHGTWLELIDER